MHKSNVLTKISFVLFLLSCVFISAAQADQKTAPSIAGLKYGIVWSSCAPWDGAATEIILSSSQQQCNVKSAFPFLRIQINDRFPDRLVPGVYQINPKQNLANQASFVYGEAKQTEPLHSFMQFPKSAVLTIQSRNEAKNTVSGEFQFTFEDGHTEKVVFEAVLCPGQNGPCG